MTLKEFTAGERLTAQDLNDNFGGVKIHEVYTGTDLDLSNSTTSETSATHEFTAITADNLGNADYIDLELNLFQFIYHDETVQGDSYIKIESKDIGGSYSDSLAKSITMSGDYNNTGTPTTSNGSLQCIRWVHTLTASEKSNGVQFRVTNYIKSGMVNPSTSTNRQVIIKGVY